VTKKSQINEISRKQDIREKMFHTKVSYKSVRFQQMYEKH